MLGLPMAALDKVVTLSDGTSAEQKVRDFLANPYVLPLNPNLEISFKSKNLRMRFDSKTLPEMYDKAVAAGVPKDQAKKSKNQRQRNPRQCVVLPSQPSHIV